MERAGRTATLGKTGGVGTSWTERLQARSATTHINAVPKDDIMGRYGVSPLEGVTENADRRLQAGEGVPHQLKLQRLVFARALDLNSFPPHFCTDY